MNDWFEENRDNFLSRLSSKFGESRGRALAVMSDDDVSSSSSGRRFLLSLSCLFFFRT